MAHEEAQKHVDDAEALHAQDDAEVDDVGMVIVVDIVEVLQRLADESTQQHQHPEAVPGGFEERVRMDGRWMIHQVEIPLIDDGRVTVEVLKSQIGRWMDGHPLGESLKPPTRICLRVLDVLVQLAGVAKLLEVILHVEWP